MTLSPEYDGNTIILTPQTRLDHEYASSFQHALAPFLRLCTRDGNPILLDLSGVPGISSVGLRVLMLAARQAKAQGGQIVLTSLQPAVREVFEISRFHQILKLFYSRTNALAALSAPVNGVAA